MHARVCVVVVVAFIDQLWALLLIYLFKGFFSFFFIIIKLGSTPPAVRTQAPCFRPRPARLCSHPGPPWSSRTRRRWTSAPRCSCTACCGNDLLDARRRSGPAGEASLRNTPGCSCLDILSSSRKHANFYHYLDFSFIYLFFNLVILWMKREYNYD